MTTVQPENQDDYILVDFDESGVQSMSFGPTDIIAKSEEAIDRAMGTVRSMAAKAMASIQAIKVSERPTTFQVEFGIKLDAEAGAMVAKVGSEASITVTMTWEHKDEK